MKKRLIRTALFTAVAFAALAGLWRLCWGVYLRAAYPVKYRELVEQSAREFNLPPSLIYAVIKYESGFDPNAVSRVDARGLMQVQPETFHWAQFRVDGGTVREDGELYDPAVNIRYGTAVLSLLRAEFGRDDVALAAYHAGRTTVKRWLADKSVSPDGVSLDHIPYADTSRYVGRVLRAQKTYASLYPDAASAPSAASLSSLTPSMPAG